MTESELIIAIHEAAPLDEIVIVDLLKQRLKTKIEELKIKQVKLNEAHTSYQGYVSCEMSAYQHVYDFLYNHSRTF